MPQEDLVNKIHTLLHIPRKYIKWNDNNLQCLLLITWLRFQCLNSITRIFRGTKAIPNTSAGKQASRNSNDLCYKKTTTVKHEHWTLKQWYARSVFLF